MFCVSKMKNRSIYFVNRAAIVNALLSAVSGSTKDSNNSHCLLRYRARGEQLLLLLSCVFCNLMTRSAIIHSLSTSFRDDLESFLTRTSKATHSETEASNREVMSGCTESFATPQEFEWLAIFPFQFNIRQVKLQTVSLAK